MSKKSPWLYHFHVPIMKSEKVEIDPIKDEDGNEIQQYKTIKKEIPFKCALKRPTRSVYEEGELFYSVELARFIQAGMLTKTLLAKRFADDGGALSSDDQSYYAELYSLLHVKEQEIQRIQLDTDNVKKRAKKLQNLLLEVTAIRQKLVEFESSQSALFDQTAEHKARNRAILWWVLHLSYIKEEEDGEYIELFGGNTMEQKLAAYDEVEEGEDFQEGGEKEHLGLALKKFAYFTSFWYSGQAVDKEGFKSAESLLDEVDIFQEIKDGQQEKQDKFTEYVKSENQLGADVEAVNSLVEDAKKEMEVVDEQLENASLSAEELKDKAIKAEKEQASQASEEPQPEEPKDE